MNVIVHAAHIMQVVTVLVLVLIWCTHAQGQSVNSATLHFMHTILYMKLLDARLSSSAYSGVIVKSQKSFPNENKHM